MNEARRDACLTSVESAVNGEIINEKVPLDRPLAVTAPKLRSTRIGLFGIGHDAYWPQFKGLKERLKVISVSCMNT